MTKFRPCIDIHQGKVKQIVGGSLRDSGAVPIENFVSDRSAGWFAELFRNDNLIGGHVIQLGAGNEIAAREALATYPGGLQIGGGIHSGNASEWLDAGASHVIITSALFDDKGKFSEDALHSITKKNWQGKPSHRSILSPLRKSMGRRDEPVANAHKFNGGSRHPGPPYALL